MFMSPQYLQHSPRNRIPHHTRVVAGPTHQHRQHPPITSTPSTAIGSERGGGGVVADTGDASDPVGVLAEGPRLEAARHVPRLDGVVAGTREHQVGGG